MEPARAGPLGKFLAALLPRSCPLCGEELGCAAGLCPSCEAGLRELPGPRCPGCGRPLLAESGLCMDCRRGPRVFDVGYPLFDYRGVAGELISAYKFGGRRSLAAYFAGRLEAPLRARWEGWPLVPVPPRPAALRERGWDQVELLARRLEARGFELRRLLFRAPSLEQKSLDREGRRRNAQRAYGLRAGLAVPPRLVLLDDVVTTGATAEACSRALREGGAREIAFVALAAD